MLLQNGVLETMFPIKQIGGTSRNALAGWTRTMELRSEHFLAAWTEKIPDSSTTPYVLPYKVAAIVAGGNVYSGRIGRGIGRGVWG